LREINVNDAVGQLEAEGERMGAFAQEAARQSGGA
jgi:hypothetical protein